MDSKAQQGTNIAYHKANGNWNYKSTAGFLPTKTASDKITPFAQAIFPILTPLPARCRRYGWYRDNEK
ncbi:MAG: hypothetical protein ACOCVT_01405 [bacterium]